MARAPNLHESNKRDLDAGVLSAGTWNGGWSPSFRSGLGALFWRDRGPKEGSRTVESLSHPFFWAPFVLVGEEESKTGNVVTK
jgi:CHAT domain-containing protein